MPTLLSVLLDIAGANLPVVLTLVIGAAVAVMVLHWMVLQDGKKHLDTGAYQRLRDSHDTQRARWRGVPRTAMAKANDVIDRLTGDTLPEAPPNPPLLIAFKTNPWTSGTMDLCLRLAVVYPVATLILVWLLTGQTLMGFETLLPAEPDAALRAVVALVMGITVGGYLGFIRSDGWQLWAWLAVAGAGAGAGALLALLALAVAGAGAVAGAAAAAAAAAAAGAIAVAGSVTGAVAVTFAGAIAIAGAGAGAGAAVAVAVAALALQYIEKLSSSHGWRGIFQTAFCIIFVAALFIASPIVAGSPGKNGAALGVFVSLAVLPVINAPFDFVSLGITRGLLRIGAGSPISKLIALWAIDVVCAALSLLALTAAMTAFLAALNSVASAQSGQNLFDLAGTLRTLQQTPADVSVWWVYGLVFSTFVPTFLHGGIMCIGLAGIAMPNTWHNNVGTWLTTGFAGEPIRQLLASAYFTLRDMLGILLAAAAFFTLLYGLWLVFPWFGSALLWVAATIANLFGADIGVVPVDNWTPIPLRPLVETISV